jgi:hypothetical protein
VPILLDAQVQDVKRLLELFPIANLRENWAEIKGSKDELCQAVAEKRDVAAISKFIDENLTCCRQHVHIFSHAGDVQALPAGVPGGEQVINQAGVHALYVVRTEYNVVLKDPLEEATLEFLWPVRIEIGPQHLIIRFVVLEKNLGSYFDRPYYLGGKTVDEDTLLLELLKAGALSTTDLHKGVKKLWDDGFMDSPRAKYKKAISIASEAMDEEKGIKEYNPELYEILQDAPLFNTLFQIPENKGCTVSVFSVDPSKGILRFPRYSEKKGDTDFVIAEILGNN